MQRASRALAREMRMPGFRKGKAPPSLVIQRLGFGAVLEEAIREALPEWYEQGAARLRGQPGRRPQHRDRLGPGGRGRAARLQVRGRGAARRRSSASTRASRWGGRRPRFPTTSSSGRWSGSARASPGSSRSSAPPPRATSLVIDFEGTIDGEAFEGGKASDYLLELGGGQLIEGFEAQLAGAEAGEERKVEVTFPDDYHAEHLAGSDAVFAVKVEGGPREDPARARRRLRLRGVGVRHDRGAARRHPLAPGGGGGSAGRAGLPCRRARRRGAERNRRAARRARDRPRRPSAGSGSSASSRAAASTPTPTSRCRGRRARR